MGSRRGSAPANSSFAGEVSEDDDDDDSTSDNDDDEDEDDELLSDSESGDDGDSVASESICTWSEVYKNNNNGVSEQ
jgi:hypothetical protein